jgi:hypothetical protein
MIGSEWPTMQESYRAAARIEMSRAATSKSNSLPRGRQNAPNGRCQNLVLFLSYGGALFRLRYERVKSGISMQRFEIGILVNAQKGRVG